MTLLTHGNRTEYALTAGDDDGLLSKKTVLNGGDVLAASYGTSCPAWVVGGLVTKSVVSAEAVTFVVTDGAVQPCAAAAQPH